nr:MFS transporter [Fodinicola feengrottensis]
MANSSLDLRPETGAAVPVRRTFWPVVLAVAAASMMLPFSVTGAAVALPSMAAHLGASVGTAQWMLNAFNITFAALPLAAGGLADRLGRRRVLLTGIAVVGVMSLLVALSPSMVLVDLARAIQGCGAATVLAAGAAVLAEATSGRRRQLAFGILGTSFGTGLAIGPLAAGALVQLAGWRSVFLLVAVMSVPIWLVATRAGESRDPARRKLDLAGVATFTAGLGCLSYAFVQAAAAGWTAPGTLLLLAAAIALTALRGAGDQAGGPGDVRRTPVREARIRRRGVPALHGHAGFRDSADLPAGLPSRSRWSEHLFQRSSAAPDDRARVAAPAGRRLDGRSYVRTHGADRRVLDDRPRRAALDDAAQ